MRRKLNVINTRQNYHGALLDATLLSKVYLRLTTGKQENLNLMDIKSKDLSNDIYSDNCKSMFTVPRKNLMVLSKSEEEKHENFVNEMINPLWKKIK